MKDLSHIDAAILAGGLGTRLRPAVSGRPKVLARVGGRPFILYLLDQLAEAGVGRVVLCTGYLGGQVAEALGESYRAMALSYSQEPSPLGTGGALRLALAHLSSETVLVLNGDSYCRANLRALCQVHRLRSANATILLVEVPDAGRFGWVRIGEQGGITGFFEKGMTQGSGWVNGGIYLINRSLLAALPPGRSLSLEREVFPAWTGQGLYGFRQPGRFIDIGTPESLGLADRFFTEEKEA